MNGNLHAGRFCTINWAGNFYIENQNYDNINNLPFTFIYIGNFTST